LQQRQQHSPRKQTSGSAAYRCCSRQSSALK
jgi:hypothetical protein